LGFFALIFLALLGWTQYFDVGMCTNEALPACNALVSDPLRCMLDQLQSCSENGEWEILSDCTDAGQGCQHIFDEASCVTGL
jgi:hypothetical protein